MSLLRQPDFSAINQAEWDQAAAERETGFAEYLGAKLGIGSETSLGGRGLDTGAEPPRISQPYVDELGQTIEPPVLQGQTRLAEEDWKKSPFFREGMSYDVGMTPELAEARAQSFDRRRWRDSLIARYQSPTGLGYLAGFGAQLLGGAWSPENWVPFVGPGLRAAAVARLGVIGGRALVGAADATLGTALADAVVLPDLRRRGEDVGISDFALDLALGAVAGGLLGTGAGVLERRAQLREAARAARVDDVHALVDQLALAADAVAHDEPIPPFIGIEQRLRGKLLGTTVLPGPVEGVEIARRPEVRVHAAEDATPEVEVSAPELGRAFTANGRAVDVAYEVVEAADLTASHTDDLQPNPAFPAELQPRDRTRAASSEQVQQIAANLQPELLGRSATAADGAPIIGPDNVVESGNGRVLALRRAYADGMPGAVAYRMFLEQEGFDTEGMTAPVLVRRRGGEMAPEERAAFTREANERTTAAMGTAERALADAKALDDRLLAMVQSGDLHAASNRGFIRAFMEKLPPAERGGFMTATGELARGGAERVRLALLAKAYGEADLIARLAEEPDSGLGPLGQALADVAPQWAKLRGEIAAGAVAPHGDGTAGLLEAVRSIAVSRDAGNPLHFALTQGDILDGRMAIDSRAFLAAFLSFDKKGNSRLLGRQKLADLLQSYIEEARKQQPGVSMFGEAPERPYRIIQVLAGVENELTPAEWTADLNWLMKWRAPFDVFAQHPGVLEAERRMLAIPETHKQAGYGTPDWWATRRFDFNGETVVGLDGAVERLTEEARAFAKGPVRVEWQAFILLGPPAAGKSTIAEDIAKKLGAAIVDGDEAKKIIPEYQGGIGANAVHEESADVIKHVQARLQESGTNLIFPKVGASPGSIRKLIGSLRQSGYTVSVVNMAVSDDNAFARMIGRFIGKGRLIPPQYSREVDGNPTRTYRELREGHEADGFAEIDNNGAEGSAQPLTEATGAAGVLGQPRGGVRPGDGLGDRAPAGAPAGAAGPPAGAERTGTGAEPAGAEPAAGGAGAGAETAAARDLRERLAQDLRIGPRDEIARFVQEAVTAEREPPVPASVLEAARRAGKPPAEGVKALQELAQDLGVARKEGQGPAPEIADLDELRRQGRVSAEDEVALARADEDAKEIEGWATAYEQLATCVLRYEA